jgi:histidine triad (HIT) family protein
MRSRADQRGDVRREVYLLMVGESEIACPFCPLVAGAEPDRLVCRIGDVAVLMDLAPITPGHLLVVPVEHVPSLGALEAALAGRLFVVAQRCAAALRVSGLRCEGVNVFLNDGRAASQTIEHVHLHVLPRHDGDGLAAVWRRRERARVASLLALRRGCVRRSAAAEPCGVAGALSGSGLYRSGMAQDEQPYGLLLAATHAAGELAPGQIIVLDGHVVGVRPDPDDPQRVRLVLVRALGPPPRRG